MATTVDTAYPFDAGAGANVYETNWREMARHWLRSGPIYAEANQFRVYADSTGMQVKVQTGSAFVRGHYAQITSEKTLAIATYVSSRYDAVVLRADFTNNRVELDVLTGPGGITLPTLTQNSSIWEIVLAYVLVDTGSTIAAGKVLDARQFAAGAGGLTICHSAFPLSTIGGGAAAEGQALYFHDTNQFRIYDGTKWRWMGGRMVGCKLDRQTTSALTTSGTWYSPGLNDVTGLDPDGMHASTDGFVTVAEAGTYEVKMRYTFAANSTGNRAIGVHRASSAWSSGSPNNVLALQPTAATNSHVISAVEEFEMAANDVLSFCAMQTSGGSLNVTEAYVSVRLLGYRD